VQHFPRGSITVGVEFRRLTGASVTEDQEDIGELNYLCNIDLVDGETTVHTTLDGQQREAYSLTKSGSMSAYFAHKVWATRILGAVLLVLASPLILVLVALVRATSAGPALFRQARIGKNSAEFTMYKIRTMFADAESVTGPVWSVPGDSRITPVGWVLRLLHLDELPQLINVARGEMDLVGPRPERPAFVDWLAGEIPNYRDRLQVLPGVTGLAQVNLPPDETLDCVRKKLTLDCEYVRIASLSLDLRILICTLLRMIGIRHGRAVSWMALTYEVELSEERSRVAAVAKPLRPHTAVEMPASESYSDNHVTGEDSLQPVPSGEGDGQFTLGLEIEPLGRASRNPVRPR
jgi:lipopolysaccharide/colanic/teichoic acid biosynthesis glycosyltransferase